VRISPLWIDYLQSRLNGGVPPRIEVPDACAAGARCSESRTRDLNTHSHLTCWSPYAEDSGSADRDTAPTARGRGADHPQRRRQGKARIVTTKAK
jgi:hypothetical protein